MRVRVALAIAVLATMAASGTAQTAEKVVPWSARGPATAKPGAGLEVVLHADIQSDWHIYSISQMPGGPTRTVITVPEHQPFEREGSLIAPPPQVGFDPNFNIDTETYEGSVQIKVPVRVAKVASAGPQKIAIDVSFQTCNETTCLPPHTTHLFVPVKIDATTETGTGSAPAPVVPPSAVSESPTNAPVVAVAPAPSANPTAGPAQPPTSSGGQGAAAVPTQRLGSFIWLAMMMGALSLLTPCVFPMIPITVSYFTNHAGGSRRSAIFAALVYVIGIILTFTALGMLLAVIFGAGGVNRLAANPWINLLITAIFLGFAFSLFGAYFIQVPPRLMGKLDAITRSKEGTGAIGALLMGFTFTLTSFTCTAPFVGTLLAMTAEGNWRWPLAGMLAYSTVFAIPFFVLALVPQWMTGLPKAGQWMVSVKVVMGFLEIVAAMKFLSNVDLIWHWGIFTRQAVLAVWIGIGLLIVFYVLGCFRLEHDSPAVPVGAGRLMIAIVFLAVTVWMVPGLFGRPLGELESFLPPDLNPAGSAATLSSGAVEQHDPVWILNDYPTALALAKQQRRPIFIDFTGYTCTNCRWMETNMFPRPEIQSELKKFVLLRLYTDGDGKIYDQQQSMENTRFGTVALPLYVLLTPDDKLIATFPGLTRNTQDFLQFLQSAGKAE